MYKHFLFEYRDIYDLFLRIKEIDFNYSLFYNAKTERFEIHNLKDEKNSLVIVADLLDGSLISKLRQTRKERLDSLIKEIEENNEKIIKSECEAVTNKVLGDCL